MALRKYKQKPEKASEPVSADDAPALASPVAAEIPTTAAPVDDFSALRDQLGHIRFAQKPIEKQIDEMPNLSVAQRAWLRARPHALHFRPLLAEADKVATENGIQRDTPQYFSMLDYVLFHGANAAFGGNQVPMQQAPEPQAEQPTSTSLDIEVTKPADDEPDAAIYSAPPSRGDHGAVPSENQSRITLSAAQREAARAAGVSETEYGKNLIKLNAMKKAGLLRD